MNIEKIIEEIKKRETRSKWSKGVTEYAIELLDNIENGEEITKENLLNGAEDWNQYSWGGCSLIYNEEICERLATPSEQKKTRNGERRPNNQEEWLDTQARALFQASNRILKIAKNQIIEK